MMNNIDSQMIGIPCHDSIVAANISKERKYDILKRLRQDDCNTMGLQYMLTVVVGMIYVMTVNLNTEDGLTNGASCVVKFVEYKQAGTDRPSIIWVKFDDKHTGVERRRKYH